MFERGFPPYWSTLKKLIWLVGSGVAGGAAWRTLTGAIVSFIASKAKPINSLTVTLEPQQEGTGDPSPTNIRPITGWTGAKVTRTGKNIFELPPYSVLSECPKTGSYFNYAIKVKPNTEYYVQTEYLNDYTSVGKYMYVLVCDNPSNSGAFASIAHNTSGINNRGITSPSDGYIYLNALVNDGTAENYAELIANSHVIIAEGSTAPTYEPYNGTTLSATFPDTVYGGEYEFVGGVGESELAKVVLDPAKMRIYSTRGFYTYELASVIKRQKGSVVSCNMLKPATEIDVAPVAIIMNYEDGSIFASGSNLQSVIGSTEADIQAYFTSNPIEVAIKLATPVGITATPQPISTLVGQNNIWSDSGDVTVQVPSNIIVT